MTPWLPLSRAGPPPADRRHQHEGRQPPLQGQREDSRRGAVDLVRATWPVLIVDEPQSLDGGPERQAKKALDPMHPLCTLRYLAPS